MNLKFWTLFLLTGKLSCSNTALKGCMMHQDRNPMKRKNNSRRHCSGKSSCLSQKWSGGLTNWNRPTTRYYGSTIYVGPIVASDADNVRIVLLLYTSVIMPPQVIGGGIKRWCCLTSAPPPSVWPHLFCGAGHEKRRGEQLKWSLAFRLYIGSFPCAQLPEPVHIQPGWAECFCVFSL